MNTAYYTGRYRDDALNGPNRGWIVGTFMSEESRKSTEVEIKYWEYQAGQETNHPTKVSTTIECTLILQGKTQCEIDDTTTTLQAGDYIVIQPGTPNNVIASILEDCVGITIKAPSDPTAKKIVD